MLNDRRMWRWDAMTVALAVLPLQLTGIGYVAHFFNASFADAMASLIHPHVGLLLAVALLTRDRRVLGAGFVATFLGWCLITASNNMFTLEAAYSIPLQLFLLFLWTERCAAWMSAPFGAGHNFTIADMGRFVVIGVLVFPLGWSLLASVLHVLNGNIPAVYANAAVQMFVAKHVGVACLTLPIMLLWIDGYAGRNHASRLRAVWALVIVLVLVSWSLNRVMAFGYDDWLYFLQDYRLTVGAALAAVILTLSPAWSMPILVIAHFVLLHALATTANQANGIAEVGALIAHVVELNVMSLLLMAMYLVNRDRRYAYVRIEQSAHRDANTGLANANALRRDWAQRKVAPHALGFLSFDHIDMLVGSYGWPALQAMLRSVARQLSMQVGTYHLGGAQFVLLPLPRSNKAPDWKGLLAGLQKNGFELNGTRMRVTPYLGLATPKSLTPEDLDECIADAGEASMQARQRGEADPVSAIDEYGGQIPAEVRRKRLQKMTDVIRYVREGNVELYMQPIRQIDGNPPANGVSGEVLCRLVDGRGGLLMPDQFIPLLESNGSIAELDLAVLAALFDGLRRDPVLRTSVERLYVNLSGVSLSADSFRGRLKAMLAGSPVPPQALCFELTETAVISSDQQAARLFSEVREMGCLLALDDFGSGMQNFVRLKELPVQVIKIDGGFVRNATQNRSD